MAVTLTINDIRTRVDPLGTEFMAAEFDPIELWFDVASGEVTRYAPAAPDRLHNLACMMMVDYWSGVPDPPHVSLQADGAGKQFQVSMMKSGNALRFSGAMTLLSPYKVRRAL